MTPSPQNRSVRNAFQVLELLAGSPDGLSLARLTASTGLPRTTVYRLLCTLEDVGIVCHGEARFHLSAAWLRGRESQKGGPHDSGAHFSAPIVSSEGRQLAGLTLNVPDPVSCDVTAARLNRLVADLAVAVSRRIRAS